MKTIDGQSNMQRNKLMVGTRKTKLNCFGHITPDVP